MLTLYEYKENKYDPLIYKLYRFDKFVQKEVRNWAQKVGQKITNTVKGKAEDIVEGEEIEEAANVCPVDAIKVEKAEEK
jgi:ferredoxin